MNRRVKSFLNYLISIGLTFGFLYFAFRGTDFVNLWEILSRTNYLWALSMLPFLMISHMFRAWRWEYFLRPIKKDMRFRNLFSATMVGYLLNNVLPRFGELGRPYALGKLEGISRSAAFGTIFIERVFDILSFMVVVALIPLVYSGPLTQAFPWLEETGIWLTSVTICFLALFIFLMMRRDIVVRFINFITRHISPAKAKFVDHITNSFLDGFLFLKEPRHYFMIALLSVLIWVFYIIMMYFPFYAFQLVERYSLDLSTALVAQAISSLGFIIPTPGGTGSYHYFIIQTLTKLYSVDEELARSYATVTHAIGFIGTSIVGLYFFLRDKLHLAEFMKRDLTREESNEHTRDRS
ncbi:MAG: lysylphosphatidylglycerol synthase transmembrane domain-containing protein [Bacteroidota bacterium]|nr:lysylphosphatidylglycerol synthase transmembrane domain-containing protein [Bacteroidota bacterium]